jgi:hypothetical protein
MMATRIGMLIRGGLIAAAMAGAGFAMPTGGTHVRLPYQESRSSAPIILASEQQMIRCTNGCDRDLRRCGRTARCKAEHDACIRACI